MTAAPIRDVISAKTSSTPTNLTSIADLMRDMNVNRLKMIISADGETANSELRAFREEVLAEAGEVLDLYFSSDIYLEVVLKGVNKGCALKKVCEYFGCDIGSSVAAGDEENDLEMIKAAGIGCAVANAVPSVKAAAAFVTHNDCEHDGIIEIIDRFVIG